MAKDFSNPKKLGFMRFILVVFAINTVVTTAMLVFLVKGDYDMSFELVLDLVNLVFDAISFWLIWQRKKAARYFIMAFSMFNIVIGTGYAIATGAFTPIGQLSSCLFDIILFVYFLTSRRAKAVLTNPMSSPELNKAELEEEVKLYRPKKWAFWRNLIMYFCVFSVVGHWIEAAYCTLIRFGWIPGTYDPASQIWSDWLYPFPVYGVGAVACVLLLFPVKNFFQKKFKGNAIPLILSFIANAIVCTLIELVMGLTSNQDLQLWDYSDMAFNFMGQVCLQNALAFGVAATLMTWVIYPALEKLLMKVSKDALNAAFVGVVIGFAILTTLYLVNVYIPDIDDIDNDSLESLSRESSEVEQSTGNSGSVLSWNGDDAVYKTTKTSNSMSLVA